jgi:hypothetical protein
MKDVAENKNQEGKLTFYFLLYIKKNRIKITSKLKKKNPN